GSDLEPLSGTGHGWTTADRPIDQAGARLGQGGVGRLCTLTCDGCLLVRWTHRVRNQVELSWRLREPCRVSRAQSGQSADGSASLNQTQRFAPLKGEKLRSGSGAVAGRLGLAIAQQASPASAAS